ncbi:hypothetical protein PG991_013534 [Apiospora marii]|uniref:Uncharacterized protein n=2 Tax=Apiospora marii TaxID=335849 RepID=A0ABR1R6D6_9PEZI
MRFWMQWGDPHGLPAGLPPVTPESPELRRPAERLAEAFGSYTNQAHFMILQDRIKLAKARLEQFIEPMSPVTFLFLVRMAALQRGENAGAGINAFMAPLSEVLTAFSFIRHEKVAPHRQATADLVYAQLQILAEHLRGDEALPALWEEIYPYYFRQVSQFARDWVMTQVGLVRREYLANPGAYAGASVLRRMDQIQQQIPGMQYNFEDEGTG